MLSIPAIADNLTYEPGEKERIDYATARARLALILHKLPAEIDAANWLDLHELTVVYNADNKGK